MSQYMILSGAGTAIVAVFEDGYCEQFEVSVLNVFGCSKFTTEFLERFRHNKLVWRGPLDEATWVSKYQATPLR